MLHVYLISLLEYSVPLRYASRDTSYIIGEADTAATLTAAYADNQISFPTPEFDKATLFVTYIPAENARNLYIQVEGGPTDSDFFPKTALLDADTGVSTLLDHIGQLPGTTASTIYKKRWEIPISDKFLRVSVKEDGADTFGLVTVQIILRYLH